MTLTPGSYGCVRTSGWQAWFIRVGTRSKFNHAFIVMDTAGRIIEADPGGARWAHISDYGNDPKVFDDGEQLTLQQRQQVMAKAQVLLGTPYGWLDIVCLAARCLGLRWQWLTRRADDEKAMICSQLVAVCGEAAGVNWLCGREAPAEVTPGDLADRLTVFPQLFPA